MKNSKLTAWMGMNVKDINTFAVGFVYKNGDNHVVVSRKDTYLFEGDFKSCYEFACSNTEKINTI